MTRKQKPPSDSIAEGIADLADTAGERSLYRSEYFDAIDRGISAWLREEEQTRSTPDRSGGLTESQRKVLEVALRRIVRGARKHRQVCVVATTVTAKRVMERQGIEGDASDIFYGWKKRLEVKQAQPVLTVDPQRPFLLVLSIEGRYRKREIRARIATARSPDGARWKFAFAEPFPAVEETMESIAAPDDPPGTDPIVAAVARSTYLVWREHNREQAERFLAFCEAERVAINMWARRATRNVRIRVGKVVIVTGETDGTLALASTGGTAKVENDSPRRPIEAGMNFSPDVLQRIAHTTLPELDLKSGLDRGAEITGSLEEDSHRSLEKRKPND